MDLKAVQNVFPAVREDIGDLQTYRVLPTQYVDHLDPFLFLNHHGPQTYPPNNRGLPFGPHPHRGFETVTFILKGDLTHKDSAGHESTIKAGGVQWMTAGRGLIHSEISSESFLREGGPLEILQLWVNLPARLKMTDPAYTGLQKSEIPVFKTEDQRGQVALASGQWQGHQGAITPLVDITSMIVNLKAGSTWKLEIPKNHQVFYYVVTGEVEVHGTKVQAFHLVQFKPEGSLLITNSLTPAVLLVCHAMPFNEPIVSHGPFVMNTREEIHQALQDYQAGKFGKD
jgi:hypothetical protein